MRKFPLSLLLLSSSIAVGQMTAVTATAVDSDGTAWAGGKWNLSIVPNPNYRDIATYKYAGAYLSPTIAYQSGTMDNDGQLTFSVYQNNYITPSGSYWSLNVCPNASTACGTYTFTASASSVNLSAPVNAIIKAPRFSAVFGAYGYIDIEASVALNPGSTYYNVTTNCQKFYNGISWVCPGSSIPSVGSSDVLNVSASQSTVNLVASTPSTGKYRINYFSNEHTLCTAGFASVVFNFSWFDPISQRTAQSIALAIGVSNSLPAGSIQGIIPIFAQASTVISYSSTITGTCTTGGPASYDIHVSVEELQ